MGRFIIIVIIYFSCAASFGQNTQFRPEFFAGNRAVLYQHQVVHQISNRLSFNNYFLLDQPYVRNEGNIYFVRNTVSLHVAGQWYSNVAFGLKNPGVFTTYSASYRKISPDGTLSYTLGFTYLKGWSFEQTLYFKKTFLNFSKTSAFYSILAVISFDGSGYTRGLQQAKLGVRKENLQFGIGFNADQFNNSEKTLQNGGAFIKFNIN